MVRSIKSTISQTHVYTAQAFGYGPCSTACSLAAESQRRDSNPPVRRVFIGSGIALQLARSKEQFFDEIIEAGSLQEISDKLEEVKPSAVISVMAPDVSVIASNLKIPTFNVDSLFWFWDWDKAIGEENFRGRVIKDFSGISAASILETLSYYHPHEQQLIGHIMADQVFAQSYPGISGTPNATFAHKFMGKYIDPSKPYPGGNKLQYVGSIIDTTYVKADVKKDTLLVSFSGQEAPTVTKEQRLLWVKFTLDIIGPSLQEFAKQHPDINIKFAGNDDILKHDGINGLISALKLPKYDVGHLRAKDWLETLGRSLAVLAPAGNTTIYEALAHNTPVLFLPEQHDGNFRSAAALASENEKAFPAAMLSELYPALRGLKEEATATVYETISRASENEKEALRANISGDIVNIIERREQLLQAQKTIDALNRYGHDGASQVVDKIEKKCDRGQNSAL